MDYSKLFSEEVERLVMSATVSGNLTARYVFTEASRAAVQLGWVETYKLKRKPARLVPRAKGKWQRLTRDGLNARRLIEESYETG